MFMRIIFVLLAALALGAGAEEEKPKVISRGEAAGSYQAFPDICRLASGELLCVFYGGDKENLLPREGGGAGGGVCMGIVREEEGGGGAAGRVRDAAAVANAARGEP